MNGTEDIVDTLEKIAAHMKPEFTATAFLIERGVEEIRMLRHRVAVLKANGEGRA